ncbi:Uu.00g009170.m01.CDS01 [Anthostomella pinea]|uniref:Uu.00g009170.m01.CDS01 n=1 Tax=Anthostomella pinea TaxID=933095 RepID=A0AAI8YPX0_9PEZI|nr:Uu.00g009170.m01.CDS01 [Anthostomella pinea]
MRQPPAKRISREDWGKHKLNLRQLYREQGLPLPQVMREMKARHNFEASKKQYRYRLGEVWGWLKYNQGHKRSQTPETPSYPASDLEDRDVRYLSVNLPESVEVSSVEFDGMPTPPSGSEDNDRADRDASFLGREFMSVFADRCFPVDDCITPYAVPKLENYGETPPAADPFEAKSRVVRGITLEILPKNGSLDVTAYHRLNSSLQGSFEKFGDGQHTELGQADNKLHITELGIIEEQPWYVEFDDSSPASRCLWSCFYWCKEKILFCSPDAEVPAPFGRLGEGEADDKENTINKDVCLFVYLWDTWASRDNNEAGIEWEQMSEKALGITPTHVLHTMSSLIVNVAADESGPPTTAAPPSPSPPPSLQRSMLSLQKDKTITTLTFIELAENGVRAIGNDDNGGWAKRKLVAEFVREFVYLHDPRGAQGQDERKYLEAARAAAEMYVERKWLSLESLDGLEAMDVLDDAEDIGGDSSVVDDDWSLDDLDDGSEVSEEE